MADLQSGWLTAEQIWLKCALVSHFFLHKGMGEIVNDIEINTSQPRAQAVQTTVDVPNEKEKENQNDICY